LLRHHLRGALIFVLTLALTNGALLVLHGLDPQPSRAVELAVLVAANLTATVTRYVAMRTWVFAHGRRAPGDSGRSWRSHEKSALCGNPAGARRRSL